jgi:DNA-binding NarL/FixJ family response regulator
MRAEVTRIWTCLRAELDEETFTALSEEGRAMSLEEVLAFAMEPPAERTPDSRLQGAPPTGLPAEGGGTYPDDLTEREVEVLRLIANGMSNQEIARELTLSLRTVERHISNIYQKIGATGKVARATATAYALRHL